MDLMIGADDSLDRCKRTVMPEQRSHEHYAAAQVRRAGAVTRSSFFYFAPDRPIEHVPANGLSDSRACGTLLRMLYTQASPSQKSSLCASGIA